MLYPQRGRHINTRRTWHLFKEYYNVILILSKASVNLSANQFSVVIKSSKDNENYRRWFT
jgi:hypothetical protein